MELGASSNYKLLVSLCITILNIWIIFCKKNPW